MKNIVWLFLMTATVSDLQSQPPKSPYPLSIGISVNKTSTLVFSSVIRHVDRGSKDVFVQTFQSAENVLLVKAGKIYFPETNLTVITEDGKIYSVLLHYDSLLSQPVHYIDIKQRDDSLHLFGMARTASYLLENSGTKIRKRSRNQDMTLGLKPGRIKDLAFYIPLLLASNSPIPYEISTIDMGIIEKNKTREAARHEEIIAPLLVLNPQNILDPYLETSLMLVVKKFTLPKDRLLCITVHEKNGARSLRLTVNYKYLTQLKPL